MFGQDAARMSQIGEGCKTQQKIPKPEIEALNEFIQVRKEQK